MTTKLGHGGPTVSKLIAINQYTNVVVKTHARVYFSFLFLWCVLWYETLYSKCPKGQIGTCLLGIRWYNF